MTTCLDVGRSKYSAYRRSKSDKAAPLESGMTNKDLKWDIKKDKRRKKNYFCFIHCSAPFHLVTFKKSFSLELKMPKMSYSNTVEVQ